MVWESTAFCLFSLARCYSLYRVDNNHTWIPKLMFHRTTEQLHSTDGETSSHPAMKKSLNVRFIQPVYRAQ